MTVTTALTLEAELETLRSLGPWLVDLLGPGDLCERVELALQEVAVNSVKHAYNGHPGTIEIRAEADPDTVRIRLFDSGSQATELPNTAPDPAELPVGGFGLMIVKQLTDSFGYERVGDQNIWTLEFRRGSLAEENL